MGRLQSGPKASTKPRLLSERLPEVAQSHKQPNQTRPATSLVEQYNAAYSRSDAAPPTSKHGRTPQAQPYKDPMTAGSFRRSAYSNTPSIDLTGDLEQHTSSSSTVEHFGEPRALWREDSASRKEPLTPRSKKRKSDDLDFDDELGDNGPRKLSQGSFTAIDTFLDEDSLDVTPKRHTKGSRPAQQFRQKDLGHKSDSQVSLQINEIPEHTQSRFKSSLSNSPPTFRGNQWKAPSIKAEQDTERSGVLPQKAFKLAVADSEEEYEDNDLQDYIATPRREDQRALKASFPTEGKSSDVKHELSSQKESLISKPVPATLPGVVQSVGGASPFQRDSPTKLEMSKPTQTEEDSEPTLGNPSAVDKSRVQDFLNLQPQQVQAYLSKLYRTRGDACHAIYEYGMAGTETPPEMQAMLRSTNIKIKVLEPLLQVREEHLRYEQRNKIVKAQLMDAIQKERQCDLELAEHQSIVAKLREIEQRALSLLNQAAPHISDGFPPSSGPLSEHQPSSRGSDPFTTTLVKATQDPPQTQFLKPQTLPPSLSTTSQIVQQTQMPVPDIRRDFQSDLVSTEKRDTTPLRTYTSSPPAKDVNAYFSPTRKLDRKAIRGLTSPRHIIPPPVLPELESHADLPGDREGLFNQNDEDLFSTHMGSPTKDVNPEDFDYDEDNFGEDEDYEGLFESVEDFSSHAPKSRTDRYPEHRSVFAETSGNVIRTQDHKGLSERADASHHMQMQYRWSSDVKTGMKERFHLRGFRHNQLEAINATLSGKDAFVLMPTGGGKSLCYQLPSIIKSGKTRGVTVVISPLLSLMQDQVEHLQKLKIQALLINSEVTSDNRRLVFKALAGPDPERYVQLLYVTPEMINKSQTLVQALRDLHSRQRLARIVIDEAHCVSQWGHDFRPDYKQLGEMRQQFTGVPVMALTATATENVKVDVIHNLGITGCEVFTQSFNRPNLTYEVRPKGIAKNTLESIASTINTSYKNQCGIIYCLSRKNCESIAASLAKEYQIKAHHYHAGMEPQDKARVQKLWQSGRYHVIVATIAFGMGIDKPDVRFVIHHTIPKSLEGYYQETGRAGRDGKRSGCYLYYGYQDTKSLKHMIDEGEGSWEQKERQRKMLRNVVQFCENKSDCRRVQVLNYFNESFKAEDCRRACDNCNSTSTFETQDFSEFANLAISLVRRLQDQNVTLLHCVDILRGGKNKKISDMEHNQLEEFGAASHLDRGDLERLFHRLVSEDALAEHHVMNKKSGFASEYVGLGRNCREFSSGRRKVKIQVRLSPNGKATTLKKAPKYSNKGTGVHGVRTDYPPSTNISSPVQAASRRRAAVRPKAMVSNDDYLEDGLVANVESEEALDEVPPVRRLQRRRERHVIHDNDEDSDENFAPVREAGRPQRLKKRDIGPPITIDEKLDSLNPIHRDVVENFLVEAKKVSDKLMMFKPLKAQPFSTTILREMAINFPKDTTEMLEIPGIDAEKVELYGRSFLKLIRDFQQSYESMMQRQEDRIQDPNHMNVIDISDDEDMGSNDLDDLDDDDFAKERSSYFPSRDVEAFNAQLSQMQPPQNVRMESPSPPVQAPTDNNYKRGGRGGFRGRGGGSRSFSRKSSNGSNKTGPSKGGKKKQASTSKPVGKGKGPFGGGGGGGIGMMPI